MKSPFLVHMAYFLDATLKIAIWLKTVTSITLILAMPPILKPQFFVILLDWGISFTWHLYFLQENGLFQIPINNIKY